MRPRAGQRISQRLERRQRVSLRQLRGPGLEFFTSTRFATL